MKRADFYDKAGEDGKDNYTTEINSDDLKNIPSTQLLQRHPVRRHPFFAQRQHVEDNNNDNRL